MSVFTASMATPATHISPFEVLQKPSQRLLHPEAIWRGIWNKHRLPQPARTEVEACTSNPVPQALGLHK